MNSQRRTILRLAALFLFSRLAGLGAEEEARPGGPDGRPSPGRAPGRRARLASRRGSLLLHPAQGIGGRGGLVARHRRREDGNEEDRRGGKPGPPRRSEAGRGRSRHARVRAAAATGFARGLPLVTRRQDDPPLRRQRPLALPRRRGAPRAPDEGQGRRGVPDLLARRPPRGVRAQGRPLHDRPRVEAGEAADLRRSRARLQRQARLGVRGRARQPHGPRLRVVAGFVGDRLPAPG